MKIGEPFIHLLEVDSTNNYAHSLLKSGMVTNGTVIFADNQLKGKGQSGKQWQSNLRENILLSIILDISFISINKQFNIIAFAALGVYDFFSKYAVEGTAIKWTNDLYWNDKKAGGVLIETVNHQSKRYAIVGIGININQTSFHPSLPNPVSLKQITGKNHEVLSLTNELSNAILIRYNQLISINSSNLIKEYNQCLYKKDKQVYLKKGNIKFTCIIKNVNEFGELVVQSGIQDSFKFGEVEWIIEK